MPLRPRLIASLALLVSARVSISAQQPIAAPTPPVRGDSLYFQFVGPTDGGRVAAIAAPLSAG